MCYIEEIDASMQCGNCKKVGAMKRLEGGASDTSYIAANEAKVTVKAGQVKIICAWCGEEHIPAPTGWELD